MTLGRFTHRQPSPAGPHEDLADAGPKDQDSEERRLAAAVVTGEVPPIWYRQRMAALAAGSDATAPAGDQPPA
jgi:hypothetical protein